MNDRNVFNKFLQRALGVTQVRTRNAILDFIPTMNDLLSLSEDEISSFVSTIHSSNTARGNSKILISPNVTVSLQALLFELKDRQICNALPDQAVIDAIQPADVAVLRRSRGQALEHKKRRKQNTATAAMTVPKFNGSNYDEFITAFRSLASRSIGLNDLPLDYLMRDSAPGTYNQAWASREEKLTNCITFQGDNYRSDREALYSLFVEHIGTTGTGSAFVNKYERTRDGHACYQDIKQHYANATYLQNKATSANAAIQNAFFHGNRRNFTIESYYTIMTNAFNDLNNSGPGYHLSEAQKIIKFEAGLKQDTAIRYAITAKTSFDELPINEQTFDRYYNIFSSLLTKYTTLLSKNNSNNNRNNPPNFIGSTGSTIQNDGGNQSRHGNRGRGSRRNGQRGGRFSNNCGRGRGRYSSNGGRGSGGSFAPIYGNFTPEAKIYNPDVFRNLTVQQKKDILAIKREQGWTDAVTPPPGYTIDMNTGFAVLSNSIINAIRTANIANANTMNDSSQAGSAPPSIVNIPPPPPPQQVPQPSTENNQGSTLQAGSQFGRQGNRNRGSVSISSVSINGMPYTGQVFDQFGNPLN